MKQLLPVAMQRSCRGSSMSAALSAKHLAFSDSILGKESKQNDTLSKAMQRICRGSSTFAALSTKHLTFPGNCSGKETVHFLWPHNTPAKTSACLLCSQPSVWLFLAASPPCPAPDAQLFFDAASHRCQPGTAECTELIVVINNNHDDEEHTYHVTKTHV